MKTVVRLVFGFSVFAAWLPVFGHSLEDACIAFSTKGPDCYSDGSVVKDGECYALVWSTDGKFEGFTASGGCLDSADRIVLVAPVAKNGCCPSVLFQISAELARELSTGVFTVYLLDTRVVSGDVSTPAGTRDGKIVLMNGYGKIVSGVGIDSTGAGFAKEIRMDGDGTIASSVASAASGSSQPRIAGMRIDGENVYLTVENRKGFMRVHGGEDVKRFDRTGAAVETSGETIWTVLVAPKTGKSGFYRVIHNK